MVSEAPNPFVQEWHNATVVHPVGLFAVLVLGAALVGVRRRYATWPLLAMACFVPSAQRLNLAGADFDLLRILVIFGTVRIVARREYAGVRWNGLDTALVAWTVASVVLPVLRVGPGLLMNRTGYAYDALGMYFLSRCLVRDWDDVLAVARGFMYLSLPVACFFAVEWATGRNLFSAFGGVPEVTAVRDGRLRCQGAFSHPILAGCFWAAALPLMAAQWWQGRRLLAVASCGAALFIIFACASATPVFGVLAACVGALLYPLRHHLQLLRWGVVAALIALHIVMKAPVWHLIARTSSLGGSSWHRYVLVDGAIRNFDEWWLVGSSVGTAHWGPSAFDVTNLYIVQGIMGGVVQLSLFLALIAIAFGRLGRLLRHTPVRKRLILIWGIGVALFVHATNHFGVTYFGQIWLSWYLVLAIAGCLASADHPRRTTRPRPRRATRRAHSSTRSCNAC